MTLQRLAEDENNEEDLKKYLIFIRGILDYSDRLSISHTRILLGILCKLASTAREEDSSSMNELFILVRKYLGMNDITHLGIYDIPLISNIPNMVYLAPTSKSEYLSRSYNK